MLKIAVTGNIASGKSLFEKCLKERGYKVLCLDNVTHFLYENSLVLQDFLLKKFNTKDRKEIADVVFRDTELKKELESFIYPLILDELNAFFAAHKDEPVVFVSAALLFEAGFNQYFDKTVLITAREDIRLQRLMERNCLTKEEALFRINSQMNEEAKKKLVDFIIDNSGSKEAFENAAGIFITTLEEL